MSEEDQLADAEVDETEAIEDQAPQEEEIETQATEQETPVFSDEEVQKKKADDAVQKRFNQITKEKYTFKERAEKAEAELARNNSTNLAEPKIEDSDYDEDVHIQKTIDFRVKQETAKAIQQQQQSKIDAERQIKGVEYNKKVEKLGIADFAEVTGQIGSISPSIGLIDAIIESGPQVAYYLGNNLDKAAEIKDASPYQAGRMLAELSGRISKSKKKLTQAPDPPQTLKGGGSIKKSIADMSMEEYEEYYNS